MQTERARFARQLDVELRVACRAEAAARRHLGDLARTLLRHRSYCALGFVRLSDYARERLGVSARSVQDAAWVATRLETLPLIAGAFDRAEISWCQAHALCRVASVTDEAAWLARAAYMTVEQLTNLAALHCKAGDPESDDDALVDDEPAATLHVPCPARIRAGWRRSLELASRVSGGPLPRWQAAEAIAAEAASGRPAGASMGERVLREAMRVAARERRGAAAMPTSPVDRAPDRRRRSADTMADARPFHGSVRSGAAEDWTAAEAPAPDPFALDAQLRFAISGIHTSAPRIGCVLRVVVDQRFYRVLGFSSVDAYVRERLGISTRKAWALIKVEKTAWRADEFRRAYYDGTVSWSRALTLLPVMARETAAAWIARAAAVTLRRLSDEVNHVLEKRDVFGSDVPLDPPPLDSALPSSVAESMGAPSRGKRVHIPAHVMVGADAAERARREVCDANVQFTGPASVVAFFRDVLDAYAEPGAPRWLALERVIQHVIGTWESLPRHHDPIFARDGWRCTVPGCSSRRNLHDHHLAWRSHGGGNARENRTAVCAAHHLHAVHRYTIRAAGEAPHAIHWELGVRPGAAALLRYVGDRVCYETDGASSATAAQG